MSDLLPCPFCGGEAVACNFTLEGAVDCETCRASIVRRHQYVHDTGYAEAIAAWNRRAIPAADARAEAQAVRAVADALDAWADVQREGRQIDASITGLRDMAKAVRALIGGAE